MQLDVDSSRQNATAKTEINSLKIKDKHLPIIYIKKDWSMLIYGFVDLSSSQFSQTFYVLFVDRMIRFLSNCRYFC